MLLPATAQTVGIDLAQPPVGMTADRTAAWALVILGLCSFVGMAAAAVVISRRERHLVVPMLMLGGIALGLSEPVFDMLGGVWYPADIPLHAATIFGRDISWGILAAYTFYFAATTYGAFALMRRGASISTLALYAALFAALDSLMEMGATRLDVFAWYAHGGDNAAAILGLPVYMIAWNGLYALISGAALFVAMPHLRGLRVALLIPAVVMAYGVALMFCSAPAVLALNNPVADGVMWTAGLVSTAVIVAVAVWAVRLPAIARLRSHPDIRRADLVAAAAS